MHVFAEKPVIIDILLLLLVFRTMFALFAGLIALVCYFLACGLLCHRLAKKQAPNKLLILTLGLIALPLHGFNVHSHIYQTDGIDLGLFNILSLVGWIIACLHIAISSYRPMLAASLVAYPAAASGLLLSELFHAPYKLLTNLPRGAESHIILSIFAYSVLFLAALHAILLAIQNKELKHRTKSRSLLLALPPLQTMEKVLFDFIGFGFALLSLAIISGFLTLDNMFAQHLVHKTILTLLAWCVFGTLLIGHYWRGWRGQRAIRFTLSGFGILLLGFYGTKLVLEIILSA